jgi:hypothetical protein
MNSLRERESLILDMYRLFQDETFTFVTLVCFLACIVSAPRRESESIQTDGGASASYLSGGNFSPRLMM